MGSIFGWILIDFWPETKGVYDRRERLNIFKDIYVHPRANPALRRRLGAYRGNICRSPRTAGDRWVLSCGNRQDAPDASKTASDASKTAQEDSKTTLRRPKRPPRRPKTRPRRLQDVILGLFRSKNKAKLTAESHSETILC